MPKARTISEEKRKENDQKEAAKIAARAAWFAQQDKPVEERKSIRQIAREHKIDHSVLSRLVNGQPTMGEFNAGKQLFTPAEELTVVEFLIRIGRRGFPLTHRLIYEKLVRLLEAKCGSSVELGQQFVNRFLHRHPRLSTYRSTPLERNRTSGMNPTAVKDYLDTVDELFNTHNPPEENILGMDEVGMNTGIFARQLVIAEAGQRHVHLHKDGERKITTVIETIAGNGTTLRPTVIFKGKYRMSSWTEDNPDQANVTVSSRGYTENLIGLEYIKDFHEQTAHLQGARFLFVDGHQSHCTIEFLEFAVAHNIIVISYPPHTTHELQGLDVACFGALKIYWTQECDRYWRSTGKRVNNDTFLRVYSQARACAFTQETIRSAFRTTGLIPFRRDFLRPDAMAPALETSVKGGFPLPLPSPVRAIVDAHQRARGVARVPPLAIVPEREEDEPETRQNEEISLPEQERVEPRSSEPSENGREDATGEAEVNLADILQSTSARFLVTDSPLKSTSHLAAPVIQSVPASLRPDYSILHTGPANLDNAPRTALVDRVTALQRELRKALHVSKVERSINEAANTQLLLRDLNLGELQERLQGKEKEKTNRKRNRMAKKNARWLSGKPFMDELREERAPVEVVAVVDVDEVEDLDLDEEPDDPEETKTKWRARERAERKAKQEACLADWSQKVEEHEARGLPGPEKPKIRKLFPPAPTPPRFKSKKRGHRRQRRGELDEGLDSDVEDEGLGA